MCLSALYTKIADTISSASFRGQWGSRTLLHGFADRDLTVRTTTLKTEYILEIDYNNFDKIAVSILIQTI